MPDGRVEFEITADGRKAFASIEQVTDALNKAGHKWEKDASTSTDSISGSFEGMVKKIVGAISAAKNGNSVLKKYYTLYKNDARLHIRCVLDVDEEYKLIKKLLIITRHKFS